MAGILLQTRDHLEHYGLWSTALGHQFTQLYAGRNLKTPAWIACFMGGLSNHAVHHAFLHIPFNRLEAAFERTQRLLSESGLPEMTRDRGYFHETLRLSRRSLLIEN